VSDPEAPTRNALRNVLEPDFLVHEDWTGRHKHAGERVKYDLVIHPRKHLVERGFDEGYVVIEVKRFDQNAKKAHDEKARDLLWQCVAYSFSEIQLPEGRVQAPLFVLYFLAGHEIEASAQAEFTLLHHFVQRGGVGRLDVSDGRDWAMRFGGSFYFRSKYGRGRNNVGVKRQTGSSR
jgi:hypothetical protein